MTARPPLMIVAAPRIAPALSARAIFSLVEGVLLRPLPFADPERLVMLGEHLSLVQTLA